MDDLTPTDSKPLAKTASSECSPALWRRLTDSNYTFSDAVQFLREDTVDLPGLRQEIVVAAKQLARHAAPCGSKAVVSTLMPLISLYGVSDKSEAEWATFWGFYISALENLPHEALRAGVDDYIARSDSEFFPRPGPLKALCEKHAIPIRMAMSRAKKVAEQAA